MLKIDLHIHTIASGHANCTLVEYIDQAKKNRMKVIGIADHGPANGETIVSEIYFTELSRVPKIVDGIRILKGIEANILDNGRIDLSDKGIKKMDFIMAGLHKHAGFTDRGLKNNTADLVKLIKSGKIEIVSHPFLNTFPIDLEVLAAEACKNNVLMEINVSYLTGMRGEERHKQNLINLRRIIKVVKKYKKKIIIGSDAHNIWELGDDSPLRKIKKQISLTDSMIINNYPKELMGQLGIK